MKPKSIEADRQNSGIDFNRIRFNLRPSSPSESAGTPTLQQDSSNPCSPATDNPHQITFNDRYRNLMHDLRQGEITQDQFTANVEQLKKIEGRINMHAISIGNMRDKTGRKPHADILRDKPPKKKERLKPRLPRILFNKINPHNIFERRQKQLNVHPSPDETIDFSETDVIQAALMAESPENKLTEAIQQARQAQAARRKILPQKPGDKYLILGGHGYLGKDTAVIIPNGIGVFAVLPPNDNSSSALAERNKFSRVLTNEQISSGQVSLEVAPGGRKLSWLRRIVRWIPDIGTIVAVDRVTGAEYKMMGVQNPTQVIADLENAARLKSATQTIKEIADERPDLIERLQRGDQTDTSETPQV